MAVWNGTAREAGCRAGSASEASDWPAVPAVEAAVRSRRRKTATGTCCRFGTGSAWEIGEEAVVQNFLDIASEEVAAASATALDTVALQSAAGNLAVATQVGHMLAVRGY